MYAAFHGDGTPDGLMRALFDGLAAGRVERPCSGTGPTFDALDPRMLLALPCTGYGGGGGVPCDGRLVPPTPSCSTAARCCSSRGRCGLRTGVRAMLAAAFARLQSSSRPTLVRGVALRGYRRRRRSRVPNPLAAVENLRRANDLQRRGLASWFFVGASSTTWSSSSSASRRSRFVRDRRATLIEGPQGPSQRSARGQASRDMAGLREQRAPLCLPMPRDVFLARFAGSRRPMDAGGCGRVMVTADRLQSASHPRPPIPIPPSHRLRRAAVCEPPAISCAIGAPIAPEQHGSAVGGQSVWRFLSPVRNGGGRKAQGVASSEMTERRCGVRRALACTNRRDRASSESRGARRRNRARRCWHQPQSRSCLAPDSCRKLSIERLPNIMVAPAPRVQLSMRGGTSRAAPGPARSSMSEATAAAAVENAATIPHNLWAASRNRGAYGRARHPEPLRGDWQLELEACHRFFRGWLRRFPQAASKTLASISRAMGRWVGAAAPTTLSIVAHRVSVGSVWPGKTVHARSEAQSTVHFARAGGVSATIGQVQACGTIVLADRRTTWNPSSSGMCTSRAGDRVGGIRQGQCFTAVAHDPHRVSALGEQCLHELGVETRVLGTRMRSGAAAGVRLARKRSRARPRWHGWSQLVRLIYREDCLEQLVPLHRLSRWPSSAGLGNVPAGSADHMM